jgi:hypothetical protein
VSCGQGCLARFDRDTAERRLEAEQQWRMETESRMFRAHAALAEIAEKAAGLGLTEIVTLARLGLRRRADDSTQDIETKEADRG